MLEKEIKSHKPCTEIYLDKVYNKSLKCAVLYSPKLDFILCYGKRFNFTAFNLLRSSVHAVGEWIYFSVQDVRHGDLTIMRIFRSRHFYRATTTQQSYLACDSFKPHTTAHLIFILFLSFISR